MLALEEFATGPVYDDVSVLNRLPTINLKKLGLQGTNFKQWQKILAKSLENVCTAELQRIILYIPKKQVINSLNT